MNRNLRFVFVQLLFSLAAGQAAIKIGDLVIEGFSFADYHYIYFHLILSVIILSASWVGYQISTATENPLISIFSIQYVILLVDIFLVICYFIIVRGAELSNYAEQGVTKTLKPNIEIETFWCMIIFMVYFFWDILTKIPELKYIKNNDGYKKETKFGLTKFGERAWATVICLGLSILVYFTTLQSELTPIRATLIDIALISLCFLFRGLKQETKRVYKLTEEKVPDKVKQEWTKTKEYPTYPISVIENHFLLKFFVLKILPFLCFIICYIMFFYS